VQGTKTNSIVNEQDQEEHARLRKAFNGFFSTENIDSTMSQLVAQIQAACISLTRRAESGQAGDMNNIVTTDMKQLMADIIDDVVREVSTPVLTLP
jgi:cytochrome P450